MGNFFLGKPLHWIVIIAIVAVLWLIGSFHLHVTQFNAFILIVLGLALTAVAIVVFGYRPGDRVMRDPIEAGGGEDVERSISE